MAHDRLITIAQPSTIFNGNRRLGESEGELG